MKRGIALLLVLVSLAFVSVIAVEIVFSSRVDARISKNARDRLQAYYHSVSGAKLALLRLHVYKELKNKKFVKDDIADSVWSFRLPQVPLKKGQKNFENWPGYFFHSIESEGSKIPVNLLDANIHRKSDKGKADTVRKEITRIIESLKEDEEFDDIYPDLKPEDLVGPLVDWIDENNTKDQGGDESSDYDSSSLPYQPRNGRMISLSELAMIYNWNDDLAARIGQHMSVLNLSVDVNPNYLPLSRIATFSKPPLDRAALMIIEKRRREKPFSSLQDLQDFVRGEPEIENRQTFDVGSLKQSTSENAFIIEGVGVVGQAKRTTRLGVRFETKPKDPGKPESVETLEVPRVIFVEEGE